MVEIRVHRRPSGLLTARRTTTLCPEKLHGLWPLLLRLMTSTFPLRRRLRCPSGLLAESRPVPFWPRHPCRMCHHRSETSAGVSVTEHSAPPSPVVYPIPSDRRRPNLQMSLPRFATQDFALTPDTTPPHSVATQLYPSSPGPGRPPLAMIWQNLTPRILVLLCQVLQCPTSCHRYLRTSTVSESGISGGVKSCRFAVWSVMDSDMAGLPMALSRDSAASSGMVWGQSGTVRVTAVVVRGHPCWLRVHL